MAIQVTCPGCHARFKVSDKFGGKKGPCPKCKTIIDVPRADNKVVIHEPDHSEYGARNAQGESVLKPIERLEVVTSPVLIFAVVGILLLFLFVAFALRNSGPISPWVLYIGAVGIAPLLTWGGYSFLRNDEDLQPFSGKPLIIRTVICSVLYAAIWLGINYAYTLFFGDDPLEPWFFLMIIAPVACIGALVAFVCYDLEVGNAFFHYGLYLMGTIVLRWISGLPAIGPSEKVQPATETATTLAVELFQHVGRILL